MNTCIKKIIATVGIALFSLVFIPEMEAQLLKNISKGLEKVNKALDKADKAINGKSNSNKQPSTASNTSVSTPVAMEVISEESEAGSVAESGDSEVRYARPYLTSQTFFLEAEPWNVSNAYDGVFSVKRNNKYEFWKVDGQKLFDANWESCSPALEKPEFHDGVLAMRKASEGYKLGRICLLYADGRVKEMAQTWNRVTNFVDGVATVVTNANTGNNSFYIDTTGKRIYPSISIDGTATNALRPLRDGMRAFVKGYEQWGYMDANGVVKMAAKFKSASDFSEGYAWVVTSDDTKQLIDKAGKCIFKAPNRNSSTSDVVNGRFYVVKGNDVCYYDLQGNLLKCFEQGNCFYDGYAFVTEPENFGDISSLVIDKDMNVVRHMSWKVVPADIVCEHGPVFTKSGLAAVNCMNGSYLLKPNGEVVLSDFNDLNGSSINSFSPVSDCGYTLASNVWVNDIQASAIVKSTGEIVWLISESMRLCGPYKSGSSFVGNTVGNVSLKEVDIHQAPIGPKVAK